MKILLTEAESRAAAHLQQGLAEKGYAAEVLVCAINFDSDSDMVDVAHRRLHAKIKDPFPTKLIHSVRGMAYVLESRP